MYDVTDVINFRSTQQTALESSQGWMIRMVDAGTGSFVGEKALTEQSLYVALCCSQPLPRSPRHRQTPARPAKAPAVSTPSMS
jgi:hypothetical protein